MSGHTPGPWVKTGALIVGFRGAPVCTLSQASLLVGSIIEREANADLITAAPDLLDALLGELAPSRSDCNERNCGACSRCRSKAAIAKAEGK